MAIREILIWPDKRLRERCLKVEEFGEDLEPLVKDLIDTMYQKDGVGISAPQIGVPLNLFVLSGELFGLLSKEKVFINTEIISTGGTMTSVMEGCLSFPGVFVPIKRYDTVTCRYQDIKGSFVEETFEGFQARAVFHEYDHVEGTLMVDHLSKLKQRAVKQKLRKKKN